jgi:hypothetical protein
MMATDGVITENIHLVTAPLASITEGGARKRLIEQGKTQAILECRTEHIRVEAQA